MEAEVQRRWEREPIWIRHPRRRHFQQGSDEPFRARPGHTSPWRVLARPSALFRGPEQLGAFDVSFAGRVFGCGPNGQLRPGGVAGTYCEAASQAQRGLDTAMERLSSGMRINYAKDDAAGQAIATRLTAEVQGLEMASRNASDAQALIDTAEGALQESHNLLLRMRELAVQSANGTMSSDDLAATDAEYQQMVEELDRVSDTTAWAGTKLLDGTNSTLTFQVGADGTSDHRISISLSNMDADSLGLKGHDRGVNNIDETTGGGGGGDDETLLATDLTTQAEAQDALARISDRGARLAQL